VCHGSDPVQIVFIDRSFSKSQVTLAQVTTEIDRTITVYGIVDDLDFIEDRSDFVGRQRGVIQVVAELGERVLEVDIILPKRVVGVEYQSLRERDLRFQDSIFAKGLAPQALGEPPEVTFWIHRAIAPIGPVVFAIVMVSGFIHNRGSGPSGVGAVGIHVIHLDHGTLRIPAFNALRAGADGP